MTTRWLLRLTLLAAMVMAVPGRAQTATGSAAALDKASRIFLRHGLQIHALSFEENPFDVRTLKGANFTGVNWGFKSRTSAMGPPPGQVPWNRWATSDTEFVVTPDERPYLPRMIAWQLRDEQDMNNPEVRAAAAKWFNTIRRRFPDTILYTNQFGGQVSNESMGKYFSECRPDMLSFDTYPLLEGPDNWMAFYGDLQRYRKLALGFGVPYAMWTQTFHGENRYRDPSESEMRVNTFAAWTFGYRMTTCFTYNASSSNLFNGPGDQNPKPAYEWIRQINRESLNLSPALVRLKSVDVRILLGEHLENGKATANPRPIDIELWTFKANDPYIRGITVKNPGRINDGAAGDVYIGWFKPIVGEHPDELYFMVLNGLCRRDAMAADCRQRITLNLHFLNSGITGIERLSRTSGKVENVPLRKMGTEARYLLDLELDGGAADLFKFRSKAPFVHLPAESRR